MAATGLHRQRDRNKTTAWSSLLCAKKSVNFPSINLLKTKRNLLYIRNQFVPRSKLVPPWLQKPSQLMIYKAKVAVCSDIRTKHSTQSEHHVEFLNVKLCYHKETARL